MLRHEAPYIYKKTCSNIKGFPQQSSHIKQQILTQNPKKQPIKVLIKKKKEKMLASKKFITKQEYSPKELTKALLQENEDLPRQEQLSKRGSFSSKPGMTYYDEGLFKSILIHFSRKLV